MEYKKLRKDTSIHNVLGLKFNWLMYATGKLCQPDISCNDINNLV